MLWHPIETAPKDGRDVLIYACHPEDRAGGEVHVASWNRRDREWLVCGDYRIGDEDDGLEVTHWSDVPPGPFKREGSH